MLKEYARRIGRLLLGLLISAVGVTMLLRANVGVKHVTGYLATYVYEK